MNIEDRLLGNDRYLRQSTLLPMQRIFDSRVMVIGVGAIGRQVALQLASMGVRHLVLVDDDVVETHNVSSQGYPTDSIGRPKVDVTAEDCLRVNPDAEPEPHAQRFSRSLIELPDVVFCCVDSIRDRQTIFHSVKFSAGLFIDGRMSAESLRVLAAWDRESQQYYQRTLFPSEEAHEGPCTARSTIYCANIAAGFMVSVFARFLRGIPINHDISLSLLADDLVIKENPESSEWSTNKGA